MNGTVVVTGGAGFIGSHLVRALLERGERVRVLDDLSTGRRENLAAVMDDVELIIGDVRDAETVGRTLRDADAVLHEAALPSVALSFDDPARVEHVNVMGTAVVMDQARRHGVGRVILASSCAVYGRTPPPLSEESPLMPLSPYAVGKLAAEGYLRTLGESGGEGTPSGGGASGRGGASPGTAHGGTTNAPGTVALRYFNVYGPRQDPSSEYSGVIARFATAASEGDVCTVYGDGHQTRDFVYVQDVVAANLLALESEAAVGQVINIGSGAETSLLDLLEGLGRASGHALDVRRAPARQGDVARSVAVIERARRMLDYAPRISLVDGLARTFAWYAEGVEARSV